MKTRNIFTVALKTIAFAWDTNRFAFITIMLLNIFMGSIVYLQYTSFSNIVDEIVRIKQGLSDYTALIRSSIVLGLSFLVPTIVGNILGYVRVKYRMQQSIALEMHKIEKQGALDIGTIESNSYQTLLRGAQEWGSSSVMNLQDFFFTSASSFAGIITSMLILWSLSGWLVLFAVMASLPVYFFYKKYSMEVFRIRYLAVDDHRVIGNRISHFEELQKAVDVILLKLKFWLKDQIRDKKHSYNAKVAAAEKRKSISYSALS